MTQHTHQTAPTQFVERNGIRFAYRRFGKPGGTPLAVQPAFPRDDGLLGSGCNRWPGQEPRGDPLQQRGRFKQFRPGPGERSADGGKRYRPRQGSRAYQGRCARFFHRRHGRSGNHSPGARSRSPAHLVGTGPRGADMSTSRSAEIFAGAYDPPEHLWLAVHFSPVPFGPRRRPRLSEAQAPPQGSRSRAERRSGDGPARSHHQILRAGRERSRLSEKDSSADADRAGQQRRHCAHTGTLTSCSRTCPMRSSSSTRMQITDRLPSTQSSSYSDADQFLSSALQNGDENLRPSSSCRFPPSSRPKEFSWAGWGKDVSRLQYPIARDP